MMENTFINNQAADNTTNDTNTQDNTGLVVNEEGNGTNITTNGTGVNASEENSATNVTDPVDPVNITNNSTNPVDGSTGEGNLNDSS